MLLDKSSCALLRHLVYLDEPETIMTISKKLNQSRRKIYYHIDKINASIPKGVAPIESIPRIGIVLSEEQKVVYKDLLAKLDSYSYIMHMQERIQLMIIYICISNDRVTIDKLIDLTEVSRNTVLSDLNEIRQLLSKEQYQLGLHVSKSMGYHLRCHPLNKIQYMHALLCQLFFDANKDFVQIVETKVRELSASQFLFSDDMTAFLVGQVQSIERELGKKINHNEIEFMLKVLPYLLLGYRNMTLDKAEKDLILSEFSPVKQRIEYRVALQLRDDLKNTLNLVLDDVEVFIIAILLLSYRKDKDIHVTSQDFAGMKHVIEQFVREFELISPYRLEKKEELVENLLAHCKSLLFRKTYGILSQNLLTTDIKDKYQLLFSLTSTASKVLEEEWEIHLSDGDIAYLTLHLGGALRRHKDTLATKHQICIVCDEGVAVQKLLLKQCQHHLPKHNILATFTTEQFKSVEDILDVDFIITTSDALDTSFSTVMVKAILDFDDVLRLNQLVAYHTLTEHQEDFLYSLQQLISSYIKDSQLATEFQERLKHMIAQDLLPNLIHQDRLSDIY